MEDVFELFDGVKGMLVDVLEGGLASVALDFETRLDVLESKLTVMGLDAIATALRRLREELAAGAGGAATPETKAILSGLLLRAITIARLFEMSMTVEAIKQDLTGGPAAGNDDEREVIPS